VQRDCAAALQGVAEVGQGRWAKLLAARAGGGAGGGGGGARLRLYELKQLLDLSEQVGEMYDMI
jgi:hypothetical protein